MRSTTWCYTASPDARRYEILKVAIPVTRKQAIFILKKKLHIKKIYYIMVCEDER